MESKPTPSFSSFPAWKDLELDAHIDGSPSSGKRVERDLDMPGPSGSRYKAVPTFSSFPEKPKLPKPNKERECRDEKLERRDRGGDQERARDRDGAKRRYDDDRRGEERDKSKQVKDHKQKDDTHRSSGEQSQRSQSDRQTVMLEDIKVRDMVISSWKVTLLTQCMIFNSGNCGPFVP